jgi:hypothetical protein
MTSQPDGREASPHAGRRPTTGGSGGRPDEPEVPVARPRPASTHVIGVRSRWERLRPRLRPRAGTLIALGLAGVAVALAWADPFFEPDSGALLVNNRSGARRVFPTLVDADPSKATIELQASDGPIVRIVPATEGGHQLMHGDVVLGPVADEDFEGLWSSLRLATAQRTAEKAHGVGQAGVIRVSLPDASLTLSLGDAAPGSGVYGVFEPDGAAWVVETEMLTLVQQPPKSWLSKRLLPIDVELVSGLAWGDELVLARGGDDFWRVRSGDAPALLSSEAVGFRLRRLLRAQLDPFIEREAVASESLRPYLVVTTVDGSSRALHVGGECPGHPRKRLVDRGPGLLGCVPAELLERWPLLEPDANMLEPRLIPHDYGRIVGLDLQLPAGLEQPIERKLIRRGGEWFYTGEGGVESVAEEEVRRWYQELGKLEVAPWTTATPSPDGEAVDPVEPGPPNGAAQDLPFEPIWSLIVHADSGDQLIVRCELERAPARCLRDDGVLLRVLGEMPRNLAFTAETFAARRLTAIGPGEVRELEILPLPNADSTTVRQSVHADMGTWELDAPEHPDDSGAIDTVRLENLLWALRGLRAESWVTLGDALPLRHIVAEVVPEQGRRQTVSATLYPDCVIAVEGQRPAAIGKAQCVALSEDLLFDDPLRFWLERSRGLELARASGSAGSTFLRRRDEQFVTGEGTPLDDPELAAQLQAFIDWRSQGIRAGQPPGPTEWTLDIRRELGPAVQVDVGTGWVRVRGADWYYVERDPEAAPTEPVEQKLDPEGIELE